MKKEKGKIVILLALSLTLALSPLITGCWNRRELTNLGIVTAIGLDQGEDHEINLTVQIIKAGSMKAAEGGTSQGKSVWVLTCSGDSVFDAVRNLVEKSGRRLYYPHNSLVVIGEKLARAGVRPFIDLFSRDQEMRLQAWVVVAKGNASDVINADSELDSIPAKQLEHMLRDSKTVSKAVASQLLDFDSDLLSNITQPVLGRVLLYDDHGNKRFRLDGAAVFRQGKLIGWMDSFETRGYLFIMNKVKSGSVIVPCPENPDQNVTLEIIRSGSKINPIVVKGKPQFTIDVNVDANLVEEACPEILSSPEMISVLENELNKAIENEIRTTLDISQTKYKVDILGFGTEVMRKYPIEWKSIASNWEKEFPQVEADAKIHSKISYTDLSK